MCILTTVNLLLPHAVFIDLFLFNVCLFIQEELYSDLFTHGYEGHLIISNFNVLNSVVHTGPWHSHHPSDQAGWIRGAEKIRTLADTRMPRRIKSKPTHPSRSVCWRCQWLKELQCGFHVKSWVGESQRGLWGSELRLCHCHRKLCAFWETVPGIWVGPGRDGTLACGVPDNFVTTTPSKSDRPSCSPSWYWSSASEIEPEWDQREWVSSEATGLNLFHLPRFH